MEQLLILNTGGTFNKRYNPLTGTLDVPADNHALEAILQHTPNLNYTLQGLIFKDSLEMSLHDRELLVKTITASPIKRVVIVHGTDTLDETASYVALHVKDKIITLTGAMVPWSISSVEATANVMLAIGDSMARHKEGIYVAMHGIVLPHQRLTKNRDKGVFEPTLLL